MPITRSAKKALRQNKKRYVRNLRYRRSVKSAIKQVRAFVAQNKPKEAEKALPQLYKIRDKAAKKNIIKKNTAARYKSRLTKAVRQQKKA